MEKHLEGSWELEVSEVHITILDHVKYFLFQILTLIQILK